MANMKLLIGGCLAFTFIIIIIIVVGVFTKWFGLAAATTAATTAPVTTMTSAPFTTAPIATNAPATYAFLPYIDRPGGDISSSQNVADAPTCESQCTSTAGCQGIAFDPAGGVCWLKSNFSNAGLVPSSVANKGIAFAPGTLPSTLTSPATLANGSALLSPAGRFFLLMQPDNNAVLYDSKTGKALWASNTAGKGTGLANLTMQNDGNLVVYDTKSTALWAWNNKSLPSATFTFTIQDDGNAVVYDSNKQPLWATSTNTS